MTDTKLECEFQELPVTIQKLQEQGKRVIGLEWKPKGYVLEFITSYNLPALTQQTFTMDEPAKGQCDG